MTEDQIETAVSRKIDRLDAQFLNSGMTPTEYDAEMTAIDAWAQRELARSRN
jgi:hypothetical protein